MKKIPLSKKIQILALACFVVLIVIHAKTTQAATISGASTDGLLLYYNFDSGSTNASVVLDKSGRGNTGTQANFLGLTTGKIGQAISFDGTVRSVTASNVDSLKLTTLTASVWVKTSGAGSGFRAIFLKSLAWGMFFGASSGGSPCADNVFNLYDFFGSTSNCSSAGATNDGLWHNYTCTIQSGVSNGTKCYMDGSIILTTTYTISNQTVGVTLGTNQSVQPVTAAVDEARIYNRILTIEQIRALAAAKPGSTVTNQDNTNGLAARWTFDMGYLTNTTAIDSAGGNNGTRTNTTPTTGKIGQALRFAGADYVTVTSSSSIALTSNFTWSYWVKYSSLPGQAAIAMGWGGSGGYFSSLCVGCAGTPRISLGRRSVAHDVFGATTISTNTWYHVATTVDGSGNAKIYINGILDKSGSTSLTAPTGNFTISDSGGFPVSGTIDDVRIYSRVLSAEEIKSIAIQRVAIGTFTSPNAGANGGLVGWWTFDGKNLTTATATDSSGAEHHGTRTNTTPVLGKLGQALKFSGADYITITGSSSLAFTSNFTWSYWVKYSSSPPLAAIPLGWTGNGGYVSTLCQTCGGQISFARLSIGHEVIGNTVLSLNKWYHVTTTVDGNGNVNIYINGVLDKTGSTGFTVPTGELLISHITNPVDGVIDDVRIYNRVLSATEVKNLYKSGGK